MGSRAGFLLTQQACVVSRGNHWSGSSQGIHSTARVQDSLTWVESPSFLLQRSSSPFNKLTQFYMHADVHCIRWYVTQQLYYFLFLFPEMLTYNSLQVYMCVGRSTWRSKVNVGFLPLLFFLILFYFFVTGSLIESGAPTLARLAGEGVPGIHLYLGPQHQDCRHHHHAWVLCGCQGSRSMWIGALPAEPPPHPLSNAPHLLQIRGSWCRWLERLFHVCVTIFHTVPNVTSFCMTQDVSFEPLLNILF